MPTFGAIFSHQSVKKMEKISQTKTVVALFMASICMLLLAVARPAVSAWGQPHSDFPVTIESYGAGATINAAEYDRIILRRGDLITLAFPEPITQMLPNPFVTTTLYGSTVEIRVKDSATVGMAIPLQFTFQGLTYTFTIQVGGDVWPGDANGDGRRNMQDLLTISLGIRRNLPPMSSSQSLLYPPHQEQMKYLTDITDWVDGQNRPLVFLLGDRTVNMKHADCNMDGRIDLTDVDYLMEVLTPLAQSENYFPLIDVVNGIHLSATPAPVPMRVSINGDLGDPRKPTQIGLEIDFEIRLTNVPLNSTDSIAGIIFSRTVTETLDFQVGFTHLSFDNGQLFGASLPRDILWRQRFWDALRNFNSGNSCATAVEKPLDVGVCLATGPLTVARNGALVGNCTITILDVLRSGGPQFINIEQAIVNGQMGIVSPSGVVVRNVKCIVDMSTVMLGSFCWQASHAVMRDGFGDRGAGAAVADSAAWISPDIWLTPWRNGEGVLQHPVPGDTVSVNVRVTNKGCEKLKDVKVLLNWGYANTAMSYPSDFSNGNGGLIDTVNIEYIAPWESATRAVRWVVPVKPGGYMSGTPVFSFFAVALDSTKIFPDVANFRNSVLRNEAVAVRSSIMLLDDQNNATPAMVNLKSPSPNPTAVTLHLTQIDGPADLPASIFGALEFFKVNNVNPPTNLVAMSFFNGWPEVSYRLNPGENHGSLDLLLGPGAIDPSIGVRFVLQTPNPGGPIHYLYKLTMVADGVTYNSSVFEITVPGA